MYICMYIYDIPNLIVQSWADLKRYLQFHVLRVVLPSAGIKTETSRHYPQVMVWSKA